MNATIVNELADVVRELLVTERKAHAAEVEGLRVELTDLREQIKAIPVGRDGKDGRDGESVVGPVGPQGPPGESMVVRDGHDGKDAVVDTDAIAKAVLAQVPTPKDGQPGAPGKDAAPVDTVALARDVLSLIPVPRDGKDGIASRDEVRAEAAKAVGELRAELLIEVKKVAADEVAALPTMQHKGVWKDGEYVAGSCVSWAGSTWHAVSKTSEKPGDGATAWVLIAKRGNPGKDAR